MKLSIVVPDKTVCQDGACYNDLNWSGTPSNVRALQWQDTSGWIEYNDGKFNEDIDTLPPWAISAQDAWYAAANPPPSPAPTPEQIQDTNKTQAILLLKSTDWTATLDIADPQYSNPYLGNQAEFLAYRSEVRQIAVDPPTTLVTTWPTLPTEQWVTV